MALTTLQQVLDTNEDLVLILIEEVKGSSPREAGTFMLVGHNTLWGTIGGGQFEYLAIDEARRMLDRGESHSKLDIPLGPDIGQCCGGHCKISLNHVTEYIKSKLIADAEQQKMLQPCIYIFGSGHVGKALANSLLLLPLNIHVIESRANELIGINRAAMQHLTPMPEALIADIPAGGAVIVTTHDHAQDFMIAAEALKRRDLAYVGMIGSATKRGSFKSFLRRETQLTDADEKRLILPIGGKDLSDKRPEMIAAMVTAEVLLALQEYRELTAQNEKSSIAHHCILD